MNFSYGSKKEKSWICSVNPSHIWTAKITARTKGVECPHCNMLAVTHPELSKQFYILNEILYGLTPYNTSRGMRIYVYWQCPKKSKHVWKASIKSRTTNKCGCQMCKSSFSKRSIRFLNKLAKELKIQIRHGKNRGEFKIKIDGKEYKFDGFHEQSNTVYEYHGCFYHGHLPEVCTDYTKYLPNTIHPLNKKFFGELYKNTLKRTQILRENGYKVVEIWECEFLKLEKVGKSLKEFLKL